LTTPGINFVIYYAAQYFIVQRNLALKTTMKINFIITVLLLLVKFSESQNTFLIHYPSDADDSFYSAAEIDGAGFILCGSKIVSTQTLTLNATISKIDMQGNIIGETGLSNSDIYSNFSFIRKSRNNISHYFVAGFQILTDSTNYSGIWEYDTNLTLVNCIGGTFGDTLLNKSLKYINIGDTTFYILCNANYPDQGPPDISILKLNQSEGIVSCFLPSQKSIRFSSGIIYDSVAGNIKVAYVGQDAKIGLPVKVMSLDLNLNATATYEPNVFFNNLNYGFSLLNDSSIIMTGYLYDFYNDKRLNAYKFDNNMNRLDSLNLFIDADTITYPGWDESVLSLDTATWVVGIYNLDPSTVWQPTPTWIQLSRINSDFELTDQFYYGGDGVYFPFDIISTSDGGIMVVGNYFNPNAVPLALQRDPFVLKVNSEGLIVNVNKPEKPTAQEAIVLPNPGSEYLQVKLAIQHKNAHFQLFDINGRLVLEENLQGDMHRVSTSSLNSGTYIYRITASNRVIGSGKWVKE